MRMDCQPRYPVLAMHYYQHHIGDYRRDTTHLSMLEHGAYRQLLDWSYLETDPVPLETEKVFRRLSAKTEDEQKAVLLVLEEFFTATEQGHVQKRVLREKATYEAKSDRARQAGKLGGRPKKTEEVISGLSKETEEKANHKPLTINHKPINPTGVRFDDFWESWPKNERKQDKKKCRERWVAGKFDALADKILADITLRKQGSKWAEPKFIEAPLVYLNNERWSDGFALMPTSKAPTIYSDKVAL